MNRFITSEPLSVYCLYDTDLSNSEDFIKSFDKKFPQKSSQKLIHSNIVSILKINLDPERTKNEE